MFEVTKQEKNSSSFASFYREGIIRTAHGNVHTPMFAPDATKGAIEYLDSTDMINIGLEMTLTNTYHLMLSPGPDFF